MLENIGFLGFHVKNPADPVFYNAYIGDSILQQLSLIIFADRHNPFALSGEQLLQQKELRMSFENGIKSMHSIDFSIPVLSGGNSSPDSRFARVQMNNIEILFPYKPVEEQGSLNIIYRPDRTVEKRTWNLMYLRQQFMP
ncbi:MAG: hypothetical protein WHT81_06370 [Rectinemataceae bacterium]